MQIEQTIWKPDEEFQPEASEKVGVHAQLVLLFGSTSVIKKREYFDDLKAFYPHAHFLGCSTAGEICDTRIYDETLIVTAIRFDHSQIQGTKIRLTETMDSCVAGKQLAQALDHEDLVHVFVLSDGLHVNGSELVSGMLECLPDEVTVTGGLSADGSRFDETYVIWDEAPQEKTVAAIGLYGSRLKIGYGSLGGWDPFGPERLVTRSEGNVLYELDGRSALELYKKYLGAHAQGLPSTGLLFPLSLRTEEGDTAVVRTILSINEQQQSMTFAGDIPEGAYARLMKANFNRLIDGAAGAAETSCHSLGSSEPDLAILISCVGRRMVLKQRTEEEIEAVRDVLGKGTVLTGFYSYGEISPFTTNDQCELHNQTMTITTLFEEME